MTMSNQDTLYNKRMKVADLLANDGNLLSILQRLDIKLGFGEATVAELCAQIGRASWRERVCLSV